MPPRLALLGLAATLASLPLAAQSRLPEMPGYEQWRRVAPLINGSMQSGALTVTWAPDGRSFEYAQEGRRFRYDVVSRAATDLGPVPARAGGPGGPGGPGRGRQFDTALSPDSTRKAFYRDRNLWLSNADGSNERQLTTDGSVEGRIKNGSASWVYGEELGQSTAMWWSPSGQQLAYYRFDESGVPDYLLQLEQTKLYSSIYTEAYPKAGFPNPVVEMFVYDVTSGRTTRVDIRSGQPFADETVGHYVYGITWSPDGRELLINRTNRRQNIMELAACAPATGACRTVVRDEWPTGWVANSPTRQFLADGQRFIWISERSGFRNLYLYHLDGRLLSTLTNHAFEVANIVRVDERTNTLWYMARSGDNHMKLQLHRVGLDGRGDRRLTDPAYHHTATPSPDGRHIVDVIQTHREAPTTRLLDATGRVLATVATSNLARYDSLGLKRVEMFTFTAADGTTDLHGLIHFPSNFDPSRRYPVLVSVYAGPGSTGARETFTMPQALTEFGFLVVTMDSRSASGRGKRFLDQIYLKLSQVETDDQAAGIRSLRMRPYVDGSRVGIYGTSYGGTVSGMALLRHGDVFQAAASSAAVVDWRQYDTIYTERYMRTPQENPEGYDFADMSRYAGQLTGRLMIYYGSADDNVHPNNQMAWIKALQDARKSFDVMVGPDRGHSGINQERMMEFFIESLVLRQAAMP